MNWIRWVALSILVISLLAPVSAAQNEKIEVVVTINVLKDIAEQVGGERVSVISLVTGLENPHTYATTPEDRKAIEDSKLFIEIGMGLEPWADDLTVDIPKEKILVASENCTKLGDNPHVWMSPENGKIIAREIEKRLERVDPADKEYYRERLSNYLSSLNQTEERMKQMAMEYSGKGVITATPAFSYLLSYLNISEIDTISKGPGKQPSTGDIMKIEDEIRGGKASVIISMYQVNMPVVQQISEDTGAPVVTCTPLLEALGIETYEQLLLYNSQAITGALEKANMQKEINSVQSDIESLKGEIALLSIGIIAVLILAVAEAYQIWKMRRGEW